MSEPNGRIKLTWQQVVWGVSLVALIVGSWADLRAQIRETKTEIVTLQKRMQRLERMTGHD